MISSNFANYLQRAKRDLDNQKEIVNLSFNSSVRKAKADQQEARGKR